MAAHNYVLPSDDVAAEHLGEGSGYPSAFAAIRRKNNHELQSQQQNAFTDENKPSRFL
jgi:hypothetical protein